MSTPPPSAVGPFLADDPLKCGYRHFEKVLYHIKVQIGGSGFHPGNGMIL
jgi:hypothetical protein